MFITAALHYVESKADFEYGRTGAQFRPGKTRGSRATPFFVRSYGRTVVATKGTGPSPLGFPNCRSISARMRRSLRVCILLAASMRPRMAALSREAGGGWSSVGDIATDVDCNFQWKRPGSRVADAGQCILLT